jgi:hypothetical protein
LSPTIRIGATHIDAVLHKTVGSDKGVRKDDLKIADKLPGLNGVSRQFETNARKALGDAPVSPLEM